MIHKIACISLMLVCWTQSAWASGNELIPVETIILEAQGESLNGQIAVGEVIRNRAKERHQSISTVCLAPFQFSCWNSAGEARNRLSKASGEAWQRASKAWAESEGIDRGFTHYHALSVAPRWARGKEGVRIGSHVFYRGIK